MAVINFKNYKIPKIEYIENENFNDGITEIDLDTEFEFEVHISANNHVSKVIIGVKLGDKQEQSQPFFLSVLIEGFFSYIPDEDENNIGFESYLKINSIAILFPYLRQAVSNITGLSNKFPPHILPTYNIAKMFEESEEVK